MLKYFDPNNTREQLGKLSLYYFIDSVGGFMTIDDHGLHADEKKVAKALFESLDLSTEEKMAIFQYIEDSENNFEEEEDD
jgi:hypothetical protein